ncbi:hypothetical protein, partial [Candidatus Binatus sp.]|uniref:hypothetical protein n=1 Tax=Candidatus Binatus sp. TaxID=2811406 RepID=UPI003C6FA3F5
GQAGQFSQALDSRCPLSLDEFARAKFQGGAIQPVPSPAGRIQGHLSRQLSSFLNDLLTRRGGFLVSCSDFVVT